jgi:hypothetical protein
MKGKKGIIVDDTEDASFNDNLNSVDDHDADDVPDEDKVVKISAHQQQELQQHQQLVTNNINSVTPNQSNSMSVTTTTIVDKHINKHIINDANVDVVVANTTLSFIQNHIDPNMRDIRKIPWKFLWKLLREKGKLTLFI